MIFIFKKYSIAFITVLFWNKAVTSGDLRGGQWLTQVSPEPESTTPLEILRVNLRGPPAFALLFPHSVLLGNDLKFHLLILPLYLFTAASLPASERNSKLSGVVILPCKGTLPAQGRANLFLFMLQDVIGCILF